MSECVVRMEMPKHCGECELQIWDIWPGSFKCAKTRTDIMSHMRNRTKPNDCPIIAGKRDAASPWHRVEEPPKEEGRYWFAVWFDGHWIFDAAWYTHDISTVLDVPCFERVGGFYKGNTEVHPDYWMPIEPPKEDA